ncbi:unnamed protein product [Nesidiocoris tenuis]|uniref:Uncharacterized protein n=1 Tax=Nesidiocoris tenuis TaxID=355587 RepID=A0A6H5GXU9_9HEMI|nr:unnamed protein product [Nesidiocoris tenuis]
MANVNCPQDCQPNGTMVFFDILHLFVFRITSATATRINYFVVASSLAIILWNAYKLSFRGVSRRRYLSGVVKGAGYLLLSWIFTVAVSVFLAASFYSVNRLLSWFTRPIWIYFLYGIPALTIPLSFVVTATKHFKKTVSEFCQVLCARSFSSYPCERLPASALLRTPVQNTNYPHDKARQMPLSMRKIQHSVSVEVNFYVLGGPHFFLVLNNVPSCLSFPVKLIGSQDRSQAFTFQPI